MIDGLWYLYDTEGVPLDVIVQAVRDRGQVVDWAAFVADAQRAGMSTKRLAAKIREVAGDVYGPDGAAAAERYCSDVLGVKAKV